ncbi:hypothetical protein ACQJBY_068529 [Aegilops geniculata]
MTLLAGRSCLAVHPHISSLRFWRAAAAATVNCHGCGQSELQFGQVNHVSTVARASLVAPDAASLVHRAIVRMILSVSLCRNLGLSFTRFLKLFAFSEISCIRRHLPPIQFVDEVRTILYNRVLAVMIRSSRPHCRQKKRLILESDDCGSKLARDGEHCTEQERNVNGIGHWYRVSVLDFRSGCPP